MRALLDGEGSVSGSPRSDLGPAARPLGERLLRALARWSLGGAPLRFSLADGTCVMDPGEAPVATVVFRDRATLVRVLLDPEETFGDAYSAGRVEIHGDLVAALEAAYHAVATAPDLGALLRPIGRHTLRTSRRNARRHYDVGNEFFRLWLDEQMIYSCAYFPTPECGLEEAQVAKMDYVCRKLRLRAGETVVEAGSGWGALALHMARRYGVRVTAYNVSAEQVRYARERAAQEGLAGRIDFVEDDYRRIRGRFDAFVSVGMLEHVGSESYGALGRVLDGCLARPHGRGLLHFIGRDHPRPLNSWIRHRLFPGASPPTLAQATRGTLEDAGFAVLDVENLRLHYAATLAHWRRRFEQAEPEVRARHGEEFARTWRLYLAGSEAAFRSGWLELFQVTFARAGHNDVAWTRAGLYDAHAEP